MQQLVAEKVQEMQHAHGFRPPADPVPASHAADGGAQSEAEPSQGPTDHEAAGLHAAEAVDTVEQVWPHDADN